MPPHKLPKIYLYQRQRRQGVDLAWLKRKIKEAVPLCLHAAKNDEAPLLSLMEIEATVISDDEIAQVHGEFMDDPTATDVITFHHGEILVSADTAARCGSEHGNSQSEELLLYLIHGLLHLGGWNDHEPEERNAMHALQDRIHVTVLGR